MNDHYLNYLDYELQQRRDIMAKAKAEFDLLLSVKSEYEKQKDKNDK